MTRIGLVRRIILSRQGAKPWAILLAILAVIVPVGLRIALDPWTTGLPFLTFFPTLLIATTILGWRWGAAVLVVSTLVANYMFQSPAMSFSLGQKELIGAGGFLISGAIIVSAAEALRRSVVELEARTRREAELNLELQHRVNNNLAIIQALAHQTARHETSPDSFYAAFSERLLAISEANKVLSQRGPEVAVLPELAEVALRPFRGRGTIHIEGPACSLPPKSCVPLVLALHELSTNAIKYGALSVANGCVRLTWTIRDGRCVLTWEERDGPPVVPPTRRGLGSRLLRPQPGLDAVKLEFPTAGAACELAIDGATPAVVGSPF